jgi:hypothetical protein
LSNVFLNVENTLKVSNCSVAKCLGTTSCFIGSIRLLLCSVECTLSSVECTHLDTISLVLTSNAELGISTTHRLLSQSPLVCDSLNLIAEVDRVSVLSSVIDVLCRLEGFFNQCLLGFCFIKLSIKNIKTSRICSSFKRNFLCSSVNSIGINLDFLFSSESLVGNILSEHCCLIVGSCSFSRVCFSTVSKTFCGIGSIQSNLIVCSLSLNSSFCSSDKVGNVYTLGFSTALELTSCT